MKNPTDRIKVESAAHLAKYGPIADSIRDPEMKNAYMKWLQELQHAYESVANISEVSDKMEKLACTKEEKESLEQVESNLRPLMFHSGAMGYIAESRLQIIILSNWMSELSNRLESVGKKPRRVRQQKGKRKTRRPPKLTMVEMAKTIKDLVTAGIGFKSLLG